MGFIIFKILYVPMVLCSIYIFIDQVFKQGAIKVYRIEWMSLVTGYSGHGSWFERDMAREARSVNRECPKISHWVGTKEVHEADTYKYIKATK